VFIHGSAAGALPQQAAAISTAIVFLMAAKRCTGLSRGEKGKHSPDIARAPQLRKSRAADMKSPQSTVQEKIMTALRQFHHCAARPAMPRIPAHPFFSRFHHA
jgi:hypothetical protein